MVSCASTEKSPATAKPKPNLDGILSHEECGKQVLGCPSPLRRHKALRPEVAPLQPSPREEVLEKEEVPEPVVFMLTTKNTFLEFVPQDRSCSRRCQSSPPVLSRAVPSKSTSQATPQVQEPLVRSFTLYVGNLPYSTCKEDLQESFAGFGIENIVLPYDRAWGCGKGYAFVTLSKGTAADAIQALNGIRIGGRAVKVRVATGEAHSPTTGKCGGAGAAPSFASPVVAQLFHDWGQRRH